MKKLFLLVLAILILAVTFSSANSQDALRIWMQFPYVAGPFRGSNWICTMTSWVDAVCYRPETGTEYNAFIVDLHEFSTWLMPSTKLNCYVQDVSFESPDSFIALMSCSAEYFTFLPEIER